MVKVLNPPIISVAPMMNYTDRHARYFLRLIATDVRLYTEMITTSSLIHGNQGKLLAFHPEEKYLALQLGGSDPAQLAYCAKIGEDYGYDEINLNVGCPSNRVRSGSFGACLMLQPELVAECVFAMQSQIKIPVTVKCRTGVDNQDAYETSQNFIGVIAQSGCKTFVIHARKAWLSGLSPKENRNIPELRYDIVRQIKQDFPQLNIILNGGLKTLADINAELPYVDGVMLGRAAYANPFLLDQIQSNYFSQKQNSTRIDIIKKFIPYIQDGLNQGIRLTSMTRPILGLFQGERGASSWRRHISEHAHKNGAGVEVIAQALRYIL